MLPFLGGINKRVPETVKDYNDSLLFSVFELILAPSEGVPGTSKGRGREEGGREREKYKSAIIALNV